MRALPAHASLLALAAPAPALAGEAGFTTVCDVGTYRGHNDVAPRSIEHDSLIDEEGLAMARDKDVWLVMDIYNGDYIDAVGTAEGWPIENLRKNREKQPSQCSRSHYRALAENLGVSWGFR